MINTELTLKEREIMKILWNSDKPMLASDIHSKTENIAEKSMHYLLNSLISKGLVKVAGRIITVKVPSRLYAPAVSVACYATSLMNEAFKSNNKRFNFKDFILCLAQNSKDKSDEIVAEMKKIVDEYEKTGELM